jgi:hypothetical protein
VCTAHTTYKFVLDNSIYQPISSLARQSSDTTVVQQLATTQSREYCTAGQKFLPCSAVVLHNVAYHSNSMRFSVHNIACTHHSYVLHAALLDLGVSQELAVDVLQCLVRSRVLFARITGAAADSGSLDLTPESTKVYLKYNLALVETVPLALCCIYKNVQQHDRRPSKTLTSYLS